MNEQERKMFLEVIEISKDNNALLHKLVRAQRWASFWRFLYWALIIGSIVVGYYWAKPFIDPFITFFTGQDFAKVMSVVHQLPGK